MSTMEDMYAAAVQEQAAPYIGEKAGLEPDPVVVAVEPIVAEVEQMAKKWIAQLVESIDGRTSTAILDTIKDVAKLTADLLLALDPGLKKFDGQSGGPATGVVYPTLSSGGSSNAETFGAQMMSQLTEALKLQYGPKPKQHDIGDLLNAVEKAKKLGQDDVAEKLQVKINELLESGDYAVKSLADLSSALDQAEEALAEIHKEEDDVEEVVSP